MKAKRDLVPGEVIFQDQPAVVGPDTSSLPLCTVCWRWANRSAREISLISFFRRVSGDFICEECRWPLCGASCQQIEAHQSECHFFKTRKSNVQISNFNVPNDNYDAILPLKVLLLKITNRRLVILFIHIILHIFIFFNIIIILLTNYFHEESMTWYVCSWTTERRLQRQN